MPRRKKNIMAKYELRGKVGIITGANAGIGKRVALCLAQAGATVVLACRSAERGEAARQEVIAQSGNVDVHLLQSTCPPRLRSGRRWPNSRPLRPAGCADQQRRQLRPAPQGPVLTAEGIETVFATNHLGPFLLTKLLRRAEGQRPARVINVAPRA
jgi:NAD(P)-dependent dehydrogenase (short-subunit alcohol dehydrogenase family)